MSELHERITAIINPKATPSDAPPASWRSSPLAWPISVFASALVLSVAIFLCGSWLRGPDYTFHNLGDRGAGFQMNTRTGEMWLIHGHEAYRIQMKSQPAPTAKPPL